jgi:hypothetical protein
MAEWPQCSYQTFVREVPLGAISPHWLDLDAVPMFDEYFEDAVTGE